jgi:hypothetical protein
LSLNRETSHLTTLNKDLAQFSPFLLPQFKVSAYANGALRTPFNVLRAMCDIQRSTVQTDYCRKIGYNFFKAIIPELDWQSSQKEKRGATS